jgi:hypothetical protein
MTLVQRIQKDFELYRLFFPYGILEPLPIMLGWVRCQVSLLGLASHCTQHNAQG